MGGHAGQVPFRHGMIGRVGKYYMCLYALLQVVPRLSTCHPQPLHTWPLNNMSLQTCPLQHLAHLCIHIIVIAMTRSVLATGRFNIL